MTLRQDISPVEVFAGTHWEAGLVKSMLENEDIKVYLFDEIRGSLAPWHVAPGGTGAVKVMVANKDFVRARYIVERYYENISNDADMEEH